MVTILSWIVRYIFIAMIYYFIYSIIRLIYLDIQQINMRGRNQDYPYLKLINRKDRLGFVVQEFYDLRENETTIGRGKENDIQILDKYISTQHSKLTVDEGAYFLEDLGSVNGTYLNSVKLQDVAEVKNGDRIGIGQVEFLFVKEVD